MEYVQQSAGIAIFVYHDENSSSFKQMKQGNVVPKFFKADFKKNSPLYSYVKQKIL
ncbi:MAG: hypothetical protein PHE54_05425 [Bacilli bacterium]|nr:hypothetical protein [Bacilli bacterium]